MSVPSGDSVGARVDLSGDSQVGNIGDPVDLPYANVITYDGSESGGVAQLSVVVGTYDDLSSNLRVTLLPLVSSVSSVISLKVIGPEQTVALYSTANGWFTMPIPYSLQTGDYVVLDGSSSYVQISVETDVPSGGTYGDLSVDGDGLYWTNPSDEMVGAGSFVLTVTNNGDPRPAQATLSVSQTNQYGVSGTSMSFGVTPFSGNGSS